MVLRARHGLRRRPHASHSIQKRRGTSICIKNEVNWPSSRRGPSLLRPDTPIATTKWRKAYTDRPCPHTATRSKLSAKRWIRSHDWWLCAATGSIHFIIDANTINELIKYDYFVEKHGFHNSCLQSSHARAFKYFCTRFFANCRLWKDLSNSALHFVEDLDVVIL